MLFDEIKLLFQCFNLKRKIDWTHSQLNKEREAIMPLILCVIDFNKKALGCGVSLWERLKLLLYASKQLCGLDLITWRSCVSCISRDFFPFFGNMMRAKKKVVCVCGIKIGEKRKLKIDNNKSSATTSSNSLYDAQTSVMIIELRHCNIYILCLHFNGFSSMRTEWMWDQFDVEVISENLVVQMKSALNYWRNHIKMDIIVFKGNVREREIETTTNPKK